MWSFTLTQTLERNFTNANSLRQEILLTPISPQLKLKLRWLATTQKITSSLELAGVDTDVNTTSTTLSNPPQKRSQDRTQKLITNYKQGLDLISYDWTNNSDPLTIRTLFSLHKLLSSGVAKPKIRTKPNIKELTNNGLKFTSPPQGKIRSRLQALFSDINSQNGDHPLLKAGKLHLELLQIAPFESLNHLTTLLFTETILAKHNFACSGLISPESFQFRTINGYLHSLNSSSAGNITTWLSYYSDTFINSLQEAIKLTGQTRLAKDQTTSLTRLNQRQRAILGLLDAPGSTISNRLVATRFKVSTITAARDLTKLKSLSLVFQKGQGRSTAYTRI